MVKSFGTRLVLQVLAFISLAGSAAALMALGYEADLHPGSPDNNVLTSWQGWWAALSLVAVVAATGSVVSAYRRDIGQS